MNDRLLLKAEEAAHALNMGRSTFWAGVKAKILPQPIKIGGITRWRTAEILSFAGATPTTTPSTPYAAEDTRPGCTQPEPHQSPCEPVAAR